MCAVRRGRRGAGGRARAWPVRWFGRGARCVTLLAGARLRARREMMREKGIGGRGRAGGPVAARWRGWEGLTTSIDRTAAALQHGAVCQSVTLLSGGCRPTTHWRTPAFDGFYLCWKVKRPSRTAAAKQHTNNDGLVWPASKPFIPGVLRKT